MKRTKLATPMAVPEPSKCKVKLCRLLEMNGRFDLHLKTTSWLSCKTEIAEG